MIVGTSNYDHIEIYDVTGGLVCVISDDDENIIKNGYDIKFCESEFIGEE